MKNKSFFIFFPTTTTMKHKQETTGCEELDYYLEHPEECPIELYLSSQILPPLPPEIGNLRNLVTLDLDNNQLTGLPQEIGNLSNLTILSLYNNQLTRLPVKIGNLSKLTMLDLSYNQLTALPLEIGNLSGLTTLNLDNNQLTGLPESIGTLSELTTLDLDNNQLTRLPDEIGNLSHLTTLNLCNNQLTSVPEEIGTLSNLTFLSLKGNTKLVYPAYSMFKLYNVTKEVVEYCSSHKDIYSPYGRWKTQWPLIRLMFVGHREKGNSFNTIPMELLRIIEEYLLSDPFVETGKSMGNIKR